MTQLTVVQIDDSSDKTISGVIAYDRSLGGILVVPSGAALPGTPEAGELFYDTTADLLYRRNDANSAWVVVGGGFTGPGSSTDNALTRWDGAGGDTVQNSGVILDDSNNLSGIGNITLTGTVDGRDIATDGTKLDGIEVGAQVNDVDSVFGRTGAVTALASDYDASQVDNDSGVAGATVADALDQLETDAVPLTNIAPANVTKAAATVGVSTEAARSDHKHDISTAAPVTITPDQANAEGTATTLSRSNHVHNVPTETAVDIGAGGTSAEGTASSFARSNHIHRIIDPSTEVSSTTVVSTSSTTAVLIPSMTITPGAGTYLAFYTGSGQHANNSTLAGYAIYANGVLQERSVQLVGGTSQSDGASFPVACQCKVTVGTSQAVEVRYARQGGSGNIFAGRRSFILVKVDD